MARYTFWQSDRIITGQCTCQPRRYPTEIGYEFGKLDPEDAHLAGQIIILGDEVQYHHDCPHCKAQEAESEPIPCSISQAKAWLKERGGSAFTRHCERDGFRGHTN